MIKIEKGKTSMAGDPNMLINEIAIGLMVVCEKVSKLTGDSEEDIVAHIMTALSGQRMARAGMSMGEVEKVLDVRINRELSCTVTEEISNG